MVQNKSISMEIWHQISLIMFTQVLKELQIENFNFVKEELNARI